MVDKQAQFIEELYNHSIKVALAFNMEPYNVASHLLNAGKITNKGLILKQIHQKLYDNRFSLPWIYDKPIC